MLDDVMKNEYAGSYSRRQQLFFRYTFLTLVDLIVLNFFNEFWGRVSIESFSISLMAAILLQVLLQLTMAVEHPVANYFKQKGTLTAKILRVLSTWVILVCSKLVILGAINFFFDDGFVFHGKFHGVFPFLVVVIAIIIAEQTLLWINRSLGMSNELN